jgi:hypothetical protein
VGAGG